MWLLAGVKKLDLMLSAYQVYKKKSLNATKMHAIENFFPINSRELINRKDLEWRKKSANKQKFLL